MNKARLLLFTTKGEFKEVQCGSLEDFYQNLECDCFDIAYRNVGGRYFDIFVDDNGLFVENPLVTAISGNLKPVLVGNLIFANHDNDGNTTSLSDEEIEYIKRHFIIVADVVTGNQREVIFPVDF